jgi:tetratricopeptide (TPR) repeat protein
LYPHALEIEAPIHATACAAGLAVTTAFLLWNAKRWPWAAVGWLWFLGTLVPVIGLVQVGGQARADRYMYLPQIGLSLIVVWGVAEICERRRVLRVWISAAACTALVALAVTATAQTAHWRDTIHLWQRVLVIDSSYFRAQRGLADALRKEERFDEAASAYAAALRLRPDDARVHFGIAEVLAAQKQFAASLPHFERAFELDPDRPRSRINFAHMLLNSGRLPEAQQQFERVERDLASGRASLTRPFRFSLHIGLATAKQRQGDLDGAIDQLRRALEVRPNSVEANARLGILALETGRDELARMHLERAVRNGGSAPALLDAIAELRRRSATP